MYVLQFCNKRMSEAPYVGGSLKFTDSVEMIEDQLESFEQSQSKGNSRNFEQKGTENVPQSSNSINSNNYCELLDVTT